MIIIPVRLNSYQTGFRFLGLFLIEYRIWEISFIQGKWN